MLDQSLSEKSPKRHVNCINIDKYFMECYDFQQVKALFGVKGAFPFYNLTIRKEM